MIDFALSDDERMAQEVARRFAAERLRPRMREHERARGVGDALRREFDETGLGRVDLPELLGGAGLGALAGALVREELAWGDAGALIGLDGLGAAGRFLATAVAAEEAARLLGGATRAVFAVDLGDKADGVAWATSDAPDAVVVAGRDGARLYREGIRAEAAGALALDAAGGCRLDLRGARPLAVASDRLDDALGAAWAYQASLLVGVARAALEYARDYAKERVAFGRPIAHHQAMAFLLTDMAIAVEAARMALWQAAADPRRGADAFLEASEAALFVTERAVQVLGGHGFIKDHPVEKWMREARALSLCAGGRDAAGEASGAQVMP